MGVYVGVDVSKATLDVVVRGCSKSVSFKVSNTASGLDSMLGQARSIARGEDLHWCMEATGPYSFMPAMFLSRQGERVSVENPRRVKHYGLAIGALHKTDRADAEVLARYVEAMKPEPWKLAEPVRAELVLLTRRLAELSRMRTQESNRLEHLGLPELVKQGIAQSMVEFDRQVAAIEARIEQIIAGDKALKESVELLVSIPGIAKRTAHVFLAEAEAIEGYASGEELAAAFGLQPKLRRSGTSLHGKTRISKAGNSHARRAFYMPTVVAIRVNPTIRAFYQRLLANHKPKKVALVAAERKLVCIAYGVLTRRKPFNPNYKPLTS